MQEDRMNNILIWTILGWAVCGICSFVAYNMAKEDLALMAEGVMDNKNHDTVKLLKTVALVHMVLMIISIGCGCLAIGLQVAVGAGASSGGYY